MRLLDGQQAEQRERPNLRGGPDRPGFRENRKMLVHPKLLC
jgi:hypothetical protein